MTEQDARTKWCPMVRTMLGHANQEWQGISITNRGETFSGPQNCLCIASECMMFRKDPKYSDSYYCGLGDKS